MPNMIFARILEFCGAGRLLALALLGVLLASLLAPPPALWAPAQPNTPSARQQLMMCSVRIFFGLLQRLRPCNTACVVPGGAAPVRGTDPSPRGARIGP